MHFIGKLLKWSLLLFFATSALAMRLPQDEKVPGGVAVIDLGIQKHRPNVYYNKKPVLLVQDERNHMIAVVGIPLGAALGQHTIYVNERLGKRSRRYSGPKYEIPFLVEPKSYPTQSLWFNQGKFAHGSGKGKGKNKKGKHSKGKYNGKYKVKEMKSVNTGGMNQPQKPIIPYKPSALDLRVERERNLLNDIFNGYTLQHVYNLGFKKPVKGRTSGVFGAQRIINGQKKARHKGFDIAAKTGTPIYAPLDGTVVLNEQHYFTGNTVILDHGQGLYTLYAHLHQSKVNVGDELDRGDMLGTVGQTGRATGPHLHLGVSLNNNRVNPALFLRDEDEDDD